VDNNELSYWGYAATKVQGKATMASIGSSIHHNHIHHNNGKGLGYGTSIQFSEALMLYNLYDHNRHSVAASGQPNEKYTAAYNLTLTNDISHEYDMHGFSDLNKHNCGGLALCNVKDSNSNYAGAEVKIINNAAVDVKRFFTIRGIPTIAAYVGKNEFNAQDPNIYRLWEPWNAGINPPNATCILTSPNDSRIDLLQNELPTYNIYVCDNNVHMNNRYIQYVSWSGTNKLKPLFFNVYTKGDIIIGDFNGDGVSDIFNLNGSEGQVSWNGVTPWDIISSSGYQTSQVALGDFDGDGKTDVFVVAGNTWEISSAGLGHWKTLHTFVTPPLSIYLMN